MNLKENIRLAWEGTRANKMRAMLTMLGIIIGIAAVIAILTVGNGMTNSIMGSMSSLGASKVTVTLQERDSETDDMMGAMFGASGDYEEDDLITEEMMEALAERYSNAIDGISYSESCGSGQVKSGRLYANISLTGINEEYMDVNGISLIKGRSFLERDIEGGRMVAVVSDKLVNNLFEGDANAALGAEISVYLNQEIISFNIIGVYEYEDSGMGNTSSEKNISTDLYIPVSAAKKIGNADDGYASFTILSSKSVDSTVFAEQVAEFLNRYYERNNDYHISASSMESMLGTMNTMLSTISVALSVIAGISLLVGGIGVMNIMLVSVTERTREIGTRKALGATNNQIRTQFVVESMIVCLIGGIIGIILGSVMGYVGSAILMEGCLPTLSSIALSVGFSLAIGIFFGYYPANKAAKLDPIEALRYE